MTTLLNTLDESTIFVTTYAIGNEKGFAVGKDFDITDYENKSEFIEAALAYASEDLGDNDPELCFSDFIFDFDASMFVSEISVDSKLWDIIELSDENRALILAYAEWQQGIEEQTVDVALETAQSLFIGKFDSDKSFAYNQVSQHKDLPEWAIALFDDEKVVEYFMRDVCEYGGYYFNM